MSNRFSLLIFAVIGSVALLIIYVLIASFNVKFIYNRRLKKQGRIIPWLDALRRTQSGDGIFVIHHGRLWWVDEKIDETNVNIYAATEKHGFLVQSHPEGKLQDLMNKEAPKRFKIIQNIPFVDPL